MKLPHDKSKGVQYETNHFITKDNSIEHMKNLLHKKQSEFGGKKNSNDRTDTGDCGRLL